jgi:prepilin peptidase CpaA
MHRVETMKALDVLSLAVGLLALAWDLKHRAIPNWIAGSGIAGGVVLHMFESGLRGLGVALEGALLGFGLFLIFYLAGGMGGGDVKLMAAFGAMLGPGGIVLAGLLAAGLGGVFAVGWLLCRRNARTIPYAPAMVLGSWMVVLSRR